MIEIFMLFFIGLGILLLGVEFLINSTSKIAKKLGISEFIISVFIIGIGTSIPDLIVAIHSAITNSSEISVGNIVESNIIIILLLTGIAALITNLRTDSKQLKKTIFFTAITTIIASYFIYTGTVPRFGGVILILAFLTYTASLYISHKEKEKISKNIVKQKTYSIKTIVKLILGIILIVLGTDVFTDSLERMQTILHLRNSIIGAFIVAPATTIPELIVTIMASIKGKTQIILGNILGSVLVNISLILGIGAVIAPTIIHDIHLQYIDLLVMIFSTILICLTSLSFKTIHKPLAIFYIVLYLFYLTHIAFRLL